MADQKKTGVTINTIASIAGVSKTTVSRYLNGKYEYMSKETRARIAEVIGENDYHPSQIARSLKTKSSNLIAVVCPDIATETAYNFQKGFGEMLYQSNYDYIVFSSYNDYKRECANLERCVNYSVAGIVFSPTTESYEKAVEIHKAGTPVVVFDRYLPSWPYNAVFIDNDEVIYEAMDDIRAKGFNQVLFLTYEVTPVDNKYKREDAFLRYMKEWSNCDVESHVCRVSGSLDMDREIAKWLETYLRTEDAKKTAIVAVNMKMLHTVVKVAQQLRFTIPSDFALYGYNSSEMACLMLSDIAYIEQPQFEMGQQAAMMILKAIKGERRRKSVVELKATFFSNLNKKQ